VIFTCGVAKHAHNKCRKIPTNGFIFGQSLQDYNINKSTINQEHANFVQEGIRELRKY
jgi:hypothetical protein